MSRAHIAYYALDPEAKTKLSLKPRGYPLSWSTQGIGTVLTLLVLALLWELAAWWQDNPLILPSCSRALLTLWQETVNGQLPGRSLNSLTLLIQAYLLGVLISAVFTVTAMTTRWGQTLLSTLTAMFNPLPAIALLPLAMLWFGLGQESLIFVILHSVVWPLALNAHSGFQSVSPTLSLVGRNIGLGSLRLTLFILIPAALPAIFSGLRIAWAFAWRTLIAAELVFGAASSGAGGLGWYIFQNRNELNTDQVFAGLICVILIGLLIEQLVFETLERLTIQRWGMKNR